MFQSSELKDFYDVSPSFFSKNRTLLVLLTVPHYMCIPERTHNCDRKAEFLSDSISEKLFRNNILTKIYLGGINRKIIDLNRFESRNTNFRKKIRYTVEKYNGVIILLDCHSFDETHTFFEKYKDPDFVILVDNLKYFSPASKLRDMLEYRGIKTNLLQGKHNDIIDEFESNPKVLISILLEVSERLENNKMIIISDTIKDWTLEFRLDS